PPPLRIERRQIALISCPANPAGSGRVIESPQNAEPAIVEPAPTPVSRLPTHAFILPGCGSLHELPAARVCIAQVRPRHQKAIHTWQPHLGGQRNQNGEQGGEREHLAGEKAQSRPPPLPADHAFGDRSDPNRRYRARHLTPRLVSDS